MLTTNQAYIITNFRDEFLHYEEYSDKVARNWKLPSGLYSNEAVLIRIV